MKRKISIAAAAALLLAAAAQAQDTAQKEGGMHKLDEVVVTATKSETELKDVTAS